MPLDYPAMVGKIATFYELRDGMVHHGLPMQGAKMLVGQVIAAKWSPNVTPGDIPSGRLIVRGRSGKTKEVWMTEQYTQLFDTWEEAIEHQKLPCNPTT